VKVEVLDPATIKIIVFWKMTPYRLADTYLTSFLKLMSTSKYPAVSIFRVEKLSVRKNGQ
jgi:hypothetical protein